MHRRWGVLGLMAGSACASAPATPEKGPEISEPAVEAEPEAEPPSEDPIVHVIDGKSVDRATWETLLSTTTEEPGSWYCDEMTDGGETGWTATDAEGKRYRVEQATHADGSTNSITSLPAVDGP